MRYPVAISTNKQNSMHCGFPEPDATAQQHKWPHNNTTGTAPAQLHKPTHRFKLEHAAPCSPPKTQNNAHAAASSDCVLVCMLKVQGMCPQLHHCVPTTPPPAPSAVTAHLHQQHASHHIPLHGHSTSVLPEQKAANTNSCIQPRPLFKRIPTTITGGEVGSATMTVMKLSLQHTTHHKQSVMHAHIKQHAHVSTGSSVYRPPATRHVHSTLRTRPSQPPAS